MDYKEFEDRQIKMSEKAQSATLGTAVHVEESETPLDILSEKTNRLDNRLQATRNSLNNLLEHLKGPAESASTASPLQEPPLNGVLGDLIATTTLSHSVLDDIEAIIYDLENIFGTKRQ